MRYFAAPDRCTAEEVRLHMLRCMVAEDTQQSALPMVCLHVLLRWGLLLFWQARLAQIGSSASKTTAAAATTTIRSQDHSGVQFSGSRG
jgi:hypothetical protein